MTSATRETLRDLFLQQFSHSVRQEIIEFGKRLSSIEADVVLFMARKSVCFYEALSYLKLTALTGVPTSDRVLDMNMSWLQGRTVALVDDTLISGTTLYRAGARLSNEGARLIGSHVFCVSTDCWNPELFNPTEPFLRLSHAQATEFCADLVRAISVVPYPYAVDYPQYRSIRIPDATLVDLYSQPNWRTREISTPLQKAAGASVLVAEPSAATLNRLSRSIGLNLSGAAQLVKVRLYGREIAKTGATWFTAMPIVVFEPLSIPNVENAWAAIAKRLAPQHQSALAAEFTSPKAKLRFLQFYVASQIGHQWVTDISDVIESRVAGALDANAIRFTFSPPVLPLITELCAMQARSPLASIKLVPADAPQRLPADAASSPQDGDPWSIQARLIEPFLQLHDREERQARDLAKRLGSRAFDDANNRVTLDRLNRGYSLPELRAIAGGSAEGLPPSAVLSEFLDYANDRGFVVPTIVDEAGTVYRAYRHGEDIKDVESFRLLVAVAVREFLQASKKNGIVGTWLEKLVVLLLQSVVEQNHIAPSDVALGATGTIGVRYGLHGAVVKEDASRLYSHHEGIYFTAVLKGLGVITEIDKTTDPSPETGDPAGAEHSTLLRRSFRLGVVPKDCPAKAAAIEIAEGLGLMLGCLYSGQLGTKLPLNDLITLATCSTPAATAAALAAELDIFKRQWRFVRARLQNTGLDPAPTSIAGDMASDMSYTAINSGRFKFRNYMRSESANIVKRIQDAADINGTMEARFFSSKWRAMWEPRVRTPQRSQADACHALAVRQGTILFELNVLVRMIMYSTSQSPDERKKLLNEITSVADEHSALLHGSPLEAEAQIAKKLHEGIERLHSASSTEPYSDGVSTRVDTIALRRWAMNQIDVRVAYIPSTLEEVDAIAARYGQPTEFDRFEHALFLESGGDAASRGVVATQFEKLFRTAHVAVKKRGRAYLASPASVHWDVPNGHIVFSRGEFAARELMTFAAEWSRHWRQNLPGRIVMFVNLPFEERPIWPKESGKVRATAFRQRLMSALEHVQLRETKPQEMFVLSPIEHSLADLVAIAQSTGLPVQQFPSTTLALTEPVVKKYHAVALSTVKARDSRNNSHPIPKKQLAADIGLISITATELAGMLESLKMLPDFREDQRFTYYSASTMGDGEPLRIAYASATGQGNVDVTSAYHALAEQYHPKLIVLIGTAGSVHNDAELGDVVMATQVVYYNQVKDRPEGIARRGQSHEVHPMLARMLKTFQATHGAGFPKFQAEQGSRGPEFSVLFGPIGTGEAVVGHKNSEIREWLKDYNDKVLAVETEAWGVTHSAYAMQAWKAPATSSVKAVLVIRGISDNADELKDSNLQRIATKHAFSVFRKFAAMLTVNDLAL